VLPIPFSIEFTIISNFIPCPIPIPIVTIIKEIKALTLNKTMRRKRSKIPKETTIIGIEMSKQFSLKIKDFKNKKTLQKKGISIKY
tara:strand:- start:54 stop:311 length:258 start_codon:yes stop_codon:yes gene_type:complete